MSKNDLIQRLLSLPGQLAAAEGRLVEAETGKRSCEAHLQLVEDQLLLGDLLTGKNEAVRSAQMRQQTAASREAVQAACATVQACRLRVSNLQSEFSSLRAIARILGGQE